MLQLLIRGFLSLMFVMAGVAHFRTPEPFVRIVPPFLPAPLALVYISGVFEILGGVGICFAKTRVFAAWGLVALLLAVLPANVYMAISGVKIFGFPAQPWQAWARIALQFVLIALVAWSCEL